MRGPRKPASYERRRKAAQASVEVLEATLSTLKEREVAVTSGEDRLKELPAQEKALVAKEVEVGEKLKAANEILERVVQDKTRVEKIGAIRSSNQPQLKSRLRTQGSICEDYLGQVCVKARTGWLEGRAQGTTGWHGGSSRSGVSSVWDYSRWVQLINNQV